MTRLTWTGRSPNERVAQLTSIGFEWKQLTNNGTWHEKADRLCAFQGEHGHVRVPVGFVVDSAKLGFWVCGQDTCIESTTRLALNGGEGIHRQALVYNTRSSTVLSASMQSWHLSSSVEFCGKYGAWPSTKNCTQGKKVVVTWITYKRIAKLNATGIE